MPHGTAAIVSQGDEIVLGQTLDTNSKWLSDRLMELGILPVEHVSLPDDEAAIAGTFQRLADRVDLVICSGGLGPTADDLTRSALARALGEELIEDQVSLEQIRAWFIARGRSMPELNRVQALRPTSSRSIPNQHGTAPGIAARFVRGGRACDVFCLPGPPRELFPMFERHVAPMVEPPRGVTVRTLVLHTIGLGESDVATLLRASAAGDLMARDRNPLVGTTASGGVVSVRLRYRGPLAPADADEELRRVAGLAKDLIGPYVFAEGGTAHEALPTAVVNAMREAGRSLAVVESCTAGLLGSMIGDVAGASDVFLGGLITYADHVKHNAARVPAHLLTRHGAVSAEVAAAMAQGGLGATSATDCLSITGIAGPGGGSVQKPVGTVWIAHAKQTAAGATTAVRRFSMAGDRRSVREWSARSALAMLWLDLRGSPERPLLREVR